MEEPKKGNESSHLENEMDEKDEPKKAARHRKKHIINKLRVQLEFYFSPANLSKDKFMHGLLNRSPYIDVEIFFKFNRIRALTDDINLLKKAIEKSKILELSDDGLRVKRIRAVNIKADETCCTIYVENIPSHVDHEWVYEIFVKFGTIDYVSFPRFKSTGRPKGFAFIEFERPEMANAALETFGAIGCKIPDNMEPSRLQSICTHESAELLNDQQMRSRESVECSDHSEGKDTSDGNYYRSTISTREMESEPEGSRKHKIEEEEVGEESQRNNSENTEPLQKKLKTDSSETNELPKTEDSSADDGKEVGERETKTKNIKVVDDVIREVRRDVDKAKEVEVREEEGTESVELLKKRSLDNNEKEHIKGSKKRKVMVDTTNSSANEVKTVGVTPTLKVKKKKKRKRSKKEKGESLDGISLKVMSKREWTRLRNQYLNMQKRNMESLKWDLQKRKYVPAIECTRQPSKNQPQFVANVVIKISFEEPPPDPKKLQEAIREGSGGGVAYVETSAVEKDVYVRFITSEAASAYLKAGLWSRMVLLSGEVEKEYWNHCINSWQMRRNKKNKHMKGTCSDVPNTFRGREKLLQKALREAKNDQPCSHKMFE